MRSVRLSAEQHRYLAGAGYLPPALQNRLPALGGVGDGTRWALDDDIAELFRTKLTERLAEVGFNADYEVTREGRILESLIDEFGV